MLISLLAKDALGLNLKVIRGYPGGPAIQRVSATGNPEAFDLPRAWLGDSDDFSFSGLKTAARRIVEASPQVSVADLAASLQEAIVSVLSDRTVEACHDLGVMELTLAGGVAADPGFRPYRRGHGGCGQTRSAPGRSLCA